MSCVFFSLSHLPSSTADLQATFEVFIFSLYFLSCIGQYIRGSLFVYNEVSIFVCMFVARGLCLYIYILVLDLSFGIICICLQGSLFLCKIVWLSLLVCIFVGLSFCMYMYIVCMYIVSLCLYIILQQVGTLHYFVCYYFFSKGMNKCLLSLLSVVMVPS